MTPEQRAKAIMDEFVTEGRAWKGNPVVWEREIACQIQEAIAAAREEMRQPMKCGHSRACWDDGTKQKAVAISFAHAFGDGEAKDSANSRALKPRCSACERGRIAGAVGRIGAAVANLD